MRILIATAAVLCLAACAAGQPHRVAAPFGKEALLGSTGVPDVGSAPGGGELVRFIPRASFGIGIVLRNTSDQAVVVTGVRVVEPRGTAVHQIGTILQLWTPPACPPGTMCPFHGFGLRPFGATPRPVEIGAGQQLAVALGFRLGSCAAGHAVSRAAPSRAIVAFHVPGGKPQQQAFLLGTARLRLTSGTSGCGLRG